MLVATIGFSGATPQVALLWHVASLVHTRGGAVFQADRGITPHPDNTGYVGVLADQSGNGHTIAQSTHNLQPEISTLSDGRTPALGLTGKEGLVLSSGAPIQPSGGSYTAWIVIEPTVTTGVHLALAQWVPTTEFLAVGMDAAWTFGEVPGFFGIGPIANPNSAQKLGLQILEFCQDVANNRSTIRRNGVPICDVFYTIGTIGLTGTDTHFFGAWAGSSGTDGVIGKVRDVVYLNKVATPAEEAVVYSGLRAHTPTLPIYGVWVPQGTVLEPSTTLDDKWVQESNLLWDTNPQILTTETAVFKLWHTMGVSNDMRIGYAESIDCVHWHRHSGPIITGYTRPGQPIKISGSYYMFAIPSGLNQQDLLTSSNGIDWTVAVAGALAHGGASDWDASVQCNTCLYVEGASWYLFYEGSSGVDSFYRIGLQTSSDSGATWTKYASNPVLDFDSSTPIDGAGGPFVVKVGSKYYMWAGIMDDLFEHVHTSGNHIGSCIARFESTDLHTWVRSSADMALYRHSPDSGWPGLYNGELPQVADITMSEVAGKVYAIFTGQRNQQESHLELATFDGSLADLVATDEGIVPGYVPEMLCNRSFEVIGYDTYVNFATWDSAASDGAIARTTTAAEVHADSSRIAACKLTAGASVDTRVSQAITGLLAGETYTLSIWARGDGTHGGRIRVQDGTTADLVTWPTTCTISTTYAQKTVTFVAPADGAATLSLFCPATAGGIAYFDDVSLKLA